MGCKIWYVAISLGEKLTGIQVMAMFDRQNDGISWSTMGLLASFKTEHGQLMPILWVQNSTPFLTQASTYMLPVIEEWHLRMSWYRDEATCHCQHLITFGYEALLIDTKWKWLKSVARGALVQYEVACNMTANSWDVWRQHVYDENTQSLFQGHLSQWTSESTNIGKLVTVDINSKQRQSTEKVIANHDFLNTAKKNACVVIETYTVYNFN